MGRCGLYAPGSLQGTEASYCEHDNETSGSISGEGFLD
jgi:hypothetical protein